MASKRQLRYQQRDVARANSGPVDPHACHAEDALVSQPAHLRGSDAFAVVDDEGHSHCVHRVRYNAEQCAAWFGADVQEWMIHD